MDDILLITTDGPVRTVTLNRPEVRNALSVDLLQRLTGELLAADDDPSVAVVILTGTDPAFCAGLDLKAALAGGAFRGLVHDAKSNPWTALRGMNTPVIGAINGACATGGLELAIQCSFLIASDRARFADTHAKVGVHPGGGMTVLLPQIVGPQRARQMTFTAEFIDAERALSWGLVNAVVPHDDLLPEARRLAGVIAGHDHRTIAALNQTYRELSELTLGEALGEEARRCVEWKATPRPEGQGR